MASSFSVGNLKHGDKKQPDRPNRYRMVNHQETFYEPKKFEYRKRPDLKKLKMQNFFGNKKATKCRGDTGTR
jgi:hypothetical protein